jgi:hypothetical protein
VPDAENVVSLSYILLATLAVFVSAAAGFVAHHVRSHFTYSPERITDIDIVDQALSGEDILFESQVVGAKWDDNGYWDVDSNRNLIYYMASFAGMTLLASLWFWPDRVKLVGQFCTFMSWVGLSSPLC